ncbi:hypothetical protein NDU88_003503 [Pleurodeles waltl]|uniref:Uncharacterized protein n=1 Tax=Pleurodeles waltl TaxID=8319 RepID=A0AAV7UGD0_PLEWA|nr:hypothetical protein NDU88_003503 [Pleurodeles waltl]
MWAADAAQKGNGGQLQRPHSSGTRQPWSHVAQKAGGGVGVAPRNGKTAALLSRAVRGKGKALISKAGVEGQSALPTRELILSRIGARPGDREERELA